MNSVAALSILLMIVTTEVVNQSPQPGLSTSYERQMTYAGRKTQRWFFNNYKGAERNYANAIRIDSTNYRAYWRRGKLRDRSEHCYPELAGKDLQKAYELINESIALNPNDTLYWHRGFMRIELGDSLGGCEDFSRARNAPLAERSFKHYCASTKKESD